MQSVAYPPEPSEKYPGELEERFRRDPFGTLFTIARECGDIAHIRSDGADIYLLNNPKYTQEVLVSQHRNVSNIVQGTANSYLGSGLLGSYGEHQQ